MKISILLMSLFVSAGAQAANLDELIFGTDFDTPTCTVAERISDSEYKYWFAVPHDGPALVKINGTKFELGLVSGRTDMWKFQKQGEAVSTKYEAATGFLKVEVLGRVSDACEPDEESCEYTEMTVDKLIIETDEETKVLTNLTGGCGV